MEDNAVDPLPCPNEGGCTQWACAADPSTSLDIAVDALPCSNEGGRPQCALPLAPQFLYVREALLGIYCR